MAQTTDKQRVVEAANELPDDATIEDAIERLCFLARVQKGLSQLDAGETIPHNEVKERILGD